MPMTPLELVNLGPGYSAPRPLDNLKDARLKKNINGAQNLSRRNFVQAELQTIENAGTASTAQRRITRAYPPDKRYLTEQSVPVRFVSPRQHTKLKGDSILPAPRRPMHQLGHALADGGRSLVHRGKNLKHHGNYKVPPQSALAFLAGAYGMPVLFRTAANFANPPDFEAIARHIDDKPFFDSNCLRAAIEYAAAELAVGTDYERAAPMVVKAANLVAVFLRSRRSSHLKTDAEDLFAMTLETLTPPDDGLPGQEVHAPHQVEDVSKFFGALTGICLAGTFAYGRMREQDRKKHQKRVEIAINMVAAAISGGSFPGISVLSGGISAMASTVAERVTRKEVDYGGALIAFGEHLTQEFNAKNSAHFQARVCIETMGSAARTCGFGLL